MDGSEQIPLALPRPVRGTTIDALLAEVYRAQYPRLVSLLIRITGDRGHAEELASDALCRLSTRPALFRPGGNLEAWLYRTAMNLGLDALKAQYRRTRHERAAAVETMRTAHEEDPLSALLRAERKQRVRSVLAALRPREAELLLLRHAGFSYQEAAEVLKINPASVGKLLTRSMAEFERKYSECYGSEQGVRV